MMTVIFYPLASLDLAEAREYLDSRDSSGLADGFDAELRSIFSKATRNPKHFHPVPEDARIRRANFNRFSYNMLYAHIEAEDVIFILTIRHNHSHPSFGMDRTWE
ncbi:MAG: type II toxin-antitoxin system RelE/ParE family toxin [Verrucomicrobiaceae bacterium]|nr:type II toxin-antitoxin system RelE/ParE family toxin [Verrucomicrobiaceae bacterium]